VQRVYPGQKINLIGTLLAVLAFGITGGKMAVNLIGCLITGAGILPAEGRFLVSHTCSDGDLLRDGEFELAILNVVTSNISWSVIVWIGYVLGRVL
jgi:F420-0:gamma-glutamyl ligase-like protein